LNGIQEVRGSIPLGSTNLQRFRRPRGAPFVSQRHRNSVLEVDGVVPHRSPKALFIRVNLGNVALEPENTVHPKKILVVDDSKLMHKIYEVMLRQYPLVYATDGRDALAQLSSHRDVDLVLLDINMPNMNGLEFLAEVRKRPELGGLPIIIISTEGREEDTARGLEAGAMAYVKKPFRSEEILDTIARLKVETAA
jgi:two-component system, chemotaxis family, chemotaxis protein CheY